MTESEKVLSELKEVLPSLIANKDVIEQAKEQGKTIEDLQNEIKSIKGNFEELEKKQTIAGKRLIDVKSSGLDMEGKLDFAKYFISVVKGRKDEVKSIIKKYNEKALNEGTGADGGYLVPEQFSDTIMKQVIQASIFLKDGQRVPLTEGYKLPLLSELTSVDASWTSEAAALTESNPTFAKSQTAAEKLSGYSLMSNEVLEDDAVGIVDYLVGRFGDSMGAKIDYQAFRGSGSPFTGIFNASGVNSVVMGSGKVDFDDVTFDNLIDAEGEIEDGNTGKAKYYLHKTILNVVKKIKDSNGNYIWFPPANGNPGTIWGYPYQTVAQMPKLSDSAVSTPFIAFGDLKNVVYGVRKEMTVKLDSSVKLLNDQSVLVVRKRIALAVALASNLAKIVTAAS